MTRALRVMGIVALACGMAAPEAAAFGFGVEPSRIELSIPAGRRRGKTIRVDNSHSDSPTHLTVYVQDVIYLPDGTHDFPPPGSTTWSCANWLDVAPKELDVAAGESAVVRVSASAPEGATGGHYAIVFFETSPSYAEEGIGVNFRVGALTEILVPGTEARQAKIANMSVQGGRTLAVDVFNEGNVLIRPKGKVKILDANGRRVTQTELNPDGLGVLPSTLRKFTATFAQPLTTGSYRARAEIDYGARRLVVGELSFSVE